MKSRTRDEFSGDCRLNMYDDNDNTGDNDNCGREAE
jgi:hypothetical protein